MIILAPMQGYTDFIFRNVFSRHYTGIDIAISPFIPLMHGKNGVLKVARDVLPFNNHTMPVIPQLFGNNPELFISTAKILNNWGYQKLNWNMGCPVKNSTRKKRGAGLLPHPELIDEILEKCITKIPQKLSVKLRLGLYNTNEIYQIIPVLNKYPIENIIIHPRTGIQMYEDGIHNDVLSDCLALFKHEIIYNGDIFSLKDFNTIKKKFPNIQKWMIGRGVFYNPLLPSILNGDLSPSCITSNKKFLTFMLDLYKELMIYKTEFQSLRKIKDLWKLFSKGFDNPAGVFEQVSHSKSLDEIIEITKKVINKKNC